MDRITYRKSHPDLWDKEFGGYDVYLGDECIGYVGREYLTYQKWQATINGRRCYFESRKRAGAAILKAYQERFTEDQRETLAYLRDRYTLTKTEVSEGGGCKVTVDEAPYTFIIGTYGTIISTKENQ